MSISTVAVDSTCRTDLASTTRMMNVPTKKNANENTMYAMFQSSRLTLNEELKSAIEGLKFPMRRLDDDVTYLHNQLSGVVCLMRRHTQIF
jgi:hypothetical protein